MCQRWNIYGIARARARSDRAELKAIIEILFPREIIYVRLAFELP